MTHDIPPQFFPSLADTTNIGRVLRSHMGSSSSSQKRQQEGLLKKKLAHRKLFACCGDDIFSTSTDGREDTNDGGDDDGGDDDGERDTSEENQKEKVDDDCHNDSDKENRDPIGNCQGGRARGRGKASRVVANNTAGLLSSAKKQKGGEERRLCTKLKRACHLTRRLDYSTYSNSATNDDDDYSSDEEENVYVEDSFVVGSDYEDSSSYSSSSSATEGEKKDVSGNEDSAAVDESDDDDADEVDSTEELSESYSLEEASSTSSSNGVPEEEEKEENESGSVSSPPARTPRTSNFGSCSGGVNPKHSSSGVKKQGRRSSSVPTRLYPLSNDDGEEDEEVKEELLTPDRADSTSGSVTASGAGSAKVEVEEDGDDEEKFGPEDDGKQLKLLKLALTPTNPGRAKNYAKLVALSRSAAARKKWGGRAESAGGGSGGRNRMGGKDAGGLLAAGSYTPGGRMRATKHEVDSLFLEWLDSPDARHNRYADADYFAANREALSQRLFNIFQHHIFDNKLPCDLKIRWSNMLRSTAGRFIPPFTKQTCNTGQKVVGLVEKEATARAAGLTPTKVANSCTVGDPTAATTTHTAATIRITGVIELSTKLLTSGHRLRQVLIHECCHAAVDLIDRKENPEMFRNKRVFCHHGTEWKKWVQKAHAAFPFLPPMERCHQYGRVEGKRTNRAKRPAKQENRELEENSAKGVAR